MCVPTQQVIILIQIPLMGPKVRSAFNLTLLAKIIHLSNVEGQHDLEIEKILLQIPAQVK